MPSHHKYLSLFLPALLFVFIGCGTDEESAEYIYPQLELQLAPNAPQQTFNVTRVVVVITGAGAQQRREFPVSPGQGQLAINLVVPLDATTIRVEAYEGQQQRPAFTGESQIAGLDKTTPKITVLLSPTSGARLQLKTPKTELAIGDTFGVEISVLEAENLFAMTFEVVFDNQKLELAGISPGPFFGADAILFSDRDLEREANRLGVAVAKRGGSTGLNGSGVAATVQFRATAAGATTVRLARQGESEVFTLQQPDGTPIPNFTRSADYLTRANLTVNIK